jgi:Ca2+-binding EF-hand superfamily protein
MLRLLLAFAVTLVLGLGTSYAQEHQKKPPERQHKSVDEIFKEKDTNQDGKLSKEEFLKGVPEERKAGAEKRFAAMDTNKDGFVTKEEMKAAFEKMKERREKKEKDKK